MPFYLSQERFKRMHWTIEHFNTMQSASADTWQFTSTLTLVVVGEGEGVGRKAQFARSVSYKCCLNDTSFSSTMHWAKNASHEREGKLHIKKSSHTQVNNVLSMGIIWHRNFFTSFSDDSTLALESENRKKILNCKKGKYLSKTLPCCCCVYLFLYSIQHKISSKWMSKKSEEAGKGKKVESSNRTFTFFTQISSLSFMFISFTPSLISEFMLYNIAVQQNVACIHKDIIPKCMSSHLQYSIFLHPQPTTFHRQYSWCRIFFLFFLKKFPSFFMRFLPILSHYCENEWNEKW